MSSAGIVIVLIQRAEHLIIEHLREAGANAPASAQTLPRLHLLGQRRLRRMLAAGAVREALPGIYYLDEAALTVYLCQRKLRRQRRLIGLGAMLLGALGLSRLNRK